MKITPDLEVWLVSDPEMSSAWRQLAKQLSLQSCIPRLEITNRRKLRTDSDKLGEVLRLWRHHHPEEYNVATLLHVLDNGHEEHVRVGGADDQGEAGSGRDRDLRVEVQHPVPAQEQEQHPSQPHLLPHPPVPVTSPK